MARGYLVTPKRRPTTIVHSDGHVAHGSRDENFIMNTNGKEFAQDFGTNRFRKKLNANAL